MEAFRGKCLKTFSRYLDKSYITGKTYTSILDKPIYNNVWTSGKGLYSYKPNKTQEIVDNEYAFRGIIKKGANYYYEPISGVYISNKLKLIE